MPHPDNLPHVLVHHNGTIRQIYSEQCSGVMVVLANGTAQHPPRIFPDKATAQAEKNQHPRLLDTFQPEPHDEHIAA